MRRADELRRLYHARQMALLRADVYAAAKGEDAPPLGWMRVGEHPEWVRHFATQIRLGDRDFVKLLRPEESGFLKAKSA